jgi:hypothetical protein
MKERSLILWVKKGDPPSERAKIIAPAFQCFLPLDAEFSIRDVDPSAPEVTRVPSLVFYLGEQVVYKIEGELDTDTVINAIKRLG